MRIRPEEARDHAGVRAVNTQAFGKPNEANLVDTLRDATGPVISLVAEEDGEIVGHALFTPVTLTGHPDLKLMALGPIAVMPERQRAGIGSQLVKDGLDRCRALGIGAVAVLGHSEYYPRFGFIPASRYGIRCEWDVPDEVFMIFELIPGYLNGATGTIRYHEAFKNV